MINNPLVAQSRAVENGIYNGKPVREVIATRGYTGMASDEGKRFIRKRAVQNC